MRIMQALAVALLTVLGFLTHAGSCSSAVLTGLLPDRVQSLLTRRHERSHRVTALPGYDGRMPSPQYAGYITGKADT